MSLEMAMITPHTPRICHKDRVADFQKPMVEAMCRAADAIDALNPDTVVLVSCHWMSSFLHYVDVTSRHKGILTAFECPDIISDVPYDHPGDPDLGNAFVEAGKAGGLSVVGIDDPTYVWDYGSVVPLRYLLKRQGIPIVDLSVCWAASIQETVEWGKMIGQVIQNSRKRIVFVASGALAHRLVRGPEHWPDIMEQALDKEFCNYLVRGDRKSALEMLPAYSKAASVESGGRHVAMLLGVLQSDFRGVLHGYGPSSGSGNPVLTIQYAS